MDDRPLITRVVLENYKSIAFCDVRLGPLSILVGPNGAGKSNFLDALRFLFEVMYAPIGNAIQNRGGFSRICHRNVSGDPRLGFRVEFCAGGRKGSFSFRVRPDAQAGYIFEREKYVLEPSLNWKWTGYNPRVPSSALHILKDPEFSVLVELLSGFHLYNFNSISLRQPSPADDEPLLNDTGSNLPNVLHHITTYRRAAGERIRQYLHAINPAIDLVDAQEVKYLSCARI